MPHAYKNMDCDGCCDLIIQSVLRQTTEAILRTAWERARDDGLIDDDASDDDDTASDVPESSTQGSKT